MACLISRYHTEPSAQCQGIFSDILRGRSNLHLQSDSRYKTGVPRAPLPGGYWKDPDNKPSAVGGSEKQAKFWGPLGILVVTLLVEESFGHSLKLGTPCKPNSAPSRTLGPKVSLVTAHSYPTFPPDLLHLELLHGEERKRRKPRILTWVPGI